GLGPLPGAAPVADLVRRSEWHAAAAPAAVRRPRRPAGHDPARAGPRARGGRRVAVTARDRAPPRRRFGTALPPGEPRAPPPGRGPAREPVGGPRYRGERAE